MRIVATRNLLSLTLGLMRPYRTHSLFEDQLAFLNPRGSLPPVHRTRHSRPAARAQRDPGRESSPNARWHCVGHQSEGTNAMAIEHLGQPLTANVIQSKAERPACTRRGFTIDGGGGRGADYSSCPWSGGHTSRAALANARRPCRRTPSVSSRRLGTRHARLGNPARTRGASRSSSATGAPAAPVSLTFGAPEIVVAGDTPENTTYGLSGTGIAPRTPVVRRRCARRRRADGQHRAQRDLFPFDLARLRNRSHHRHSLGPPHRLFSRHACGSSDVLRRPSGCTTGTTGSAASSVRRTTSTASRSSTSFWATGDIIDYIFEDNDDPDGGGNALFAREVILGRWPSAGIRGRRTAARTALHGAARQSRLSEEPVPDWCSTWTPAQSMSNRCRITRPTTSPGATP